MAFSVEISGARSNRWESSWSTISLTSSSLSRTGCSSTANNSKVASLRSEGRKLRRSSNWCQPLQKSKQIIHRRLTRYCTIRTFRFSSFSSLKASKLTAWIETASLSTSTAMRPQFRPWVLSASSSTMSKRSCLTFPTSNSSFLRRALASPRVMMMSPLANRGATNNNIFTSLNTRGLPLNPIHRQRMPWWPLKNSPGCNTRMLSKSRYLL